MKQAILEIIDKKIEEKDSFYGNHEYTDGLREIKEEVEKMDEGETLEEIIEDIGKGMCHLALLYPNAGYWQIQSGEQFDYKSESLKKCFFEFRRFLKAQKLI